MPAPIPDKSPAGEPMSLGNLAALSSSSHKPTGEPVSLGNLAALSSPTHKATGEPLSLGNLAILSSMKPSANILGWCIVYWAKIIYCFDDKKMEKIIISRSEM